MRSYAPRATRGRVRVVEIATPRADRRCARIVVHGRLDTDALHLLSSVVTAHVKAGRRDLRLDLSAAEIPVDATGRVAAIASGVADVGGALVVEAA